MVAKVESACLVGLEAFRVHVEVSLVRGLPALSIVGLPDAAVRESKDRVLAAIRNSGFEVPSRRLTVSLAPAELRKEGSAFDLPIALGILLAAEEIPHTRWPRAIWLGELALDGAIRPVRGVLPMAHQLSRQGPITCILPEANTREVEFLERVQCLGFRSLRDIVTWLSGEEGASPVRPRSTWVPNPAGGLIDFADVKGQVVAKRALEIAAAGGHNVLLTGVPGTGKSMLAKAFSSILPEWTLEESLETSQVHSVAGGPLVSGLLETRPFRSPHHSASPVSLVGGGDTPMPGDISLAHHGVLFLDELPEFRRDALEALRQPLEEGVVHVQRIRGRATFPANFLLIGAMNPCPCGLRGHPVRDCDCSDLRVQKYLGKISGPLLDRIDLHVELPLLKTEDLFQEGGTAETSQQVRRRVQAARDRQRQRAIKDAGLALNSRLRGAHLRKHCQLDQPSQELLKGAVDRLGLSARAFDRLRKVARTIADLEGTDAIQSTHVAEALQYRALDRGTFRAARL